MRFLNEAQIANSIRHPVSWVWRRLSASGGLFTMSFCKGVSLRERMRQAAAKPTSSTRPPDGSAWQRRMTWVWHRIPKKLRSKWILRCNFGNRVAERSESRTYTGFSASEVDHYFFRETAVRAQRMVGKAGSTMAVVGAPASGCGDDS